MTSHDNNFTSDANASYRTLNLVGKSFFLTLIELSCSLARVLALMSHTLFSLWMNRISLGETDRKKRGDSYY